MSLAPQEVEAWAGRELFDPYDVRIGTIRVVREPEGWFEVELADGDTRDVPVAGAVRSGQAIRTPYVASLVLAGRAQPPVAPPHPHAVQSAVPPAAGTRREMAQALRSAHSELRAALERLAALRWRVEDEELVHDLTFHHVEVAAHAAEVRERLAELDDTRAPLRDTIVRLGAWLQVKRRAVRSQAAIADAEQALALGRQERDTWSALRDLARRHGDTVTADLAQRGRADAEALLYTVAASWPRFEELDRRRL